MRLPPPPPPIANARHEIFKTKRHSCRDAHLLFDATGHLNKAWFVNG